MSLKRQEKLEILTPVTGKKVTLLKQLTVPELLKSPAWNELLGSLMFSSSTLPMSRRDGMMRKKKKTWTSFFLPLLQRHLSFLLDI